MRNNFPSNKELDSAIIEALTQLGGEAKTADIDAKVIEILELPDEIVNLEDDSGICTKLNYCLRWCRTKLKKEGKISSIQKGLWKLL